VFLKHFSQNITNIYRIIYNLKRHGNQIWQFITLSNNFYEFQLLVGLLTFDYNFFGFSFKRCSFFSCFIFTKINSRCDNVMVHWFTCSCLENQRYLCNQWFFFQNTKVSWQATYKSICNYSWQFEKVKSKWLWLPFILIRQILSPWELKHSKLGDDPRQHIISVVAKILSLIRDCMVIK
jgi:hypothetical protein